MKFEDVIRRSLGFVLPVSKVYEKLAQLPTNAFPIDTDAEAVKQFIAARVG